MSVAAVLAEQIARRGPLPVSEVVGTALYHPQFGFYETGGVAGRRGADFLTSPEVGALFGAVVARALDGWWRQMGEPDPYLVVEAGAGSGTLARTVLAAGPDCAHALRYVLVERSAALRRSQGAHLALEDPALLMPPIDPASGRPVPEAPRGPICASLAELPRLSGTPAIVLANELLDNLPFDLAERGASGWSEVRCEMESIVLETGDEVAGAVRPLSFGEVTVPLDAARATELDRLAPGAPVGGRVPLQGAAIEWLRSALAVAGPAGRAIVFDYATTTADLAARPQDSWLRTYRSHGWGAGYLEALGEQDITCEVAADQLVAVKAPARELPQRAWLEEWGVEVLVAEAKQTWKARAHIGDLQALAARSRINEAEALLDPEGLGAFRVLEWHGT
jgi:SAM-dependent MidA family methyltransferase